MADFPSMPWFVSDFFQATEEMSGDAAKTYLFLLGRAWTRGGYLKDDDDTLSRLARMSKRQWRKVKNEVLTKFEVDENDRIFNARLLEELSFVEEKSRKNRESGRLGGKKTAEKSNKINGAVVASAAANGVATLKQPTLTLTIDSESPTDSESNQTEKEPQSNICSPDGERPSKPYSNFDEFWSCWTIPKTKRGKDAARTAYDRAIKSRRGTHEEICQGVTKYMAECLADGTELRHIKFPQGWLSAGRWKDDFTSGANGHDGRNDGQAVSAERRPNGSGISAIERARREIEDRERRGQACAGTAGPEGPGPAGRPLADDQMPEGAGGEQGSFDGDLAGTPWIEDVPVFDETGAPIPEDECRLVAAPSGF